MGRPKKSPAVVEPQVEVNQPAVNNFNTERITPSSDKSEMDRVFRVINNRGHALSICRNITHQRDLNLWGVHQYSDASQNSYARSFYFRDKANAEKALAYVDSLLA